MSTTPLVSVITATHQRPDFLRRCIIAMQAQELEDYEHLIVADHCPYARKVYEQFRADPRLQFFEVPGKHIRNVGAVAKNLGIEKARAELIAYCDDDNTLLPNHLRVLHESLQQEDFDVAFSNFYEVSFHGSYRDLVARHPFDVKHFHHIDNRDMLCSMHTREAVQRVGGWIPWEVLGNYAEDNNLISRFKDTGLRIRYLEEVSCVYYSHTNWGSEDLAKKRYREKLSRMPAEQVYAYPDLASRELPLDSYPLNADKFLDLKRNNPLRRLLGRIERERDSGKLLWEGLAGAKDFAKHWIKWLKVSLRG